MTETTEAPRVKCKAITKAGAPCQAWAVHGTDLCIHHGKTPEEASKHAKHAVAVRENNRRLDTDPMFPYRLLNDQEALRLGFEMSRATIPDTYPAQPDTVQQWMGRFLLLGVTEGGKRMTRAEANAALRELYAGIEDHHHLPEEDLAQAARVSRQQWALEHVKHDALRGLIADDIPERLLLDGMTQAEAQREAREYLAQVYVHIEDISGLPSHVKAHNAMTGDTEALIPRTSHQEALAAIRAEREREALMQPPGSVTPA
jgi:hypothetical protein